MLKIFTQLVCCLCSPKKIENVVMETSIDYEFYSQTAKYTYGISTILFLNILN